ncbi:MAG TPA: hypothetical protein VGN36_08910, partial [Sphingorhabdus sp.]|nr:hypothetical protein [Sphingorhabdus sp.]
MLAVASPVFGQARIDDGCLENTFQRSPGEEILLMCSLIVVTGNLPSAAVERTESIIDVPLEQTRF